MKKKEETSPKVVTLSVDPKFYSTLMEFCKTMGFTLISTERTIPNPRIRNWDDILDVIGEKVGPPSSEEKNKHLDSIVRRNLGRLFLDELTNVSLTGAIGVALRVIHENNEPDRDKEGVLKWLENYVYPSKEWEIIKDKFLPLLYAEGYKEKG